MLSKYFSLKFNLERLLNHVLFDFFIKLIISYVLLIFILNFHTDISSAYESGVYFSYMKSLVDDHDLNIINNISKNMAWVVSSSYNYPDMHDHGASLLWAPYYLFAKQIDFLINLNPIKLAKVYSFIQFDTITILILNFLFGLLGLKIFKNISDTYFKIELPIWFILAIIFSTGFFNYLIYQFDSADISLFFYTACFVYFSFNLKSDVKNQDLFLLGIIAAFGSVIKISFPMILPVSLFFYFRNVKKYSFAHLAFFSFGYLCIQLLKNLNNNVKFGFTNLLQGYEYAYKVEYLFSPIQHWRSFFGPAGVFLIAPTIFLATLLFLYYIARFFFKKEHPNSDILFFLTITSSLVAKHLLNFFIIVDGMTGFGSRHYLMDTGALIVLFGLIYKYKASNKIFYRLTLAYLVASVVITSAVFLWFLEIDSFRIPAFNTYYIQDFFILKKQLLEIYKNIYHLLTNLNAIFLDNIKYLFLLAPAVLLWQFFDTIFMGKKAITVTRLFALFVLFLYLITTGLNLINNSTNVSKLKANNFFQKTVIGSGVNIYLYDEYLSEFAYMMDISKYDKNYTLYTFQRNILLSLIEKTKNEIVFDPIGFLPMLNRGELKEITIENHDKPIVSILDYNAPVRFKIWP